MKKLGILLCIIIIIAIAWYFAVQKISKVKELQAEALGTMLQQLETTTSIADKRPYINGKPDGTGTSMTTYDQPLTISGDTASSVYFDGIIDDARIYNYALTAAQINMVLNDGASPKFKR